MSLIRKCQSIDHSLVGWVGTRSVRFRIAQSRPWVLCAQCPLFGAGIPLRGSCDEVRLPRWWTAAAAPFFIESRPQQRPVFQSLGPASPARVNSGAAPQGNHVRMAPAIFGKASRSSVAHLTIGPRVRLVSEPYVRCKSDTRNIGLLAFLMVLAFAVDNRRTG